MDSQSVWTGIRVCEHVVVRLRGFGFMETSTANRESACQDAAEPSARSRVSDLQPSQCVTIASLFCLF